MAAKFYWKEDFWNLNENAKDEKGGVEIIWEIKIWKVIYKMWFEKSFFKKTG